MSKKTGISRSNLYAIFKGEQQPQLSTALKIIKELGYSIKEAADKLGIGAVTVRRRILDKTIKAEYPSKKLGYRISEEELNKYAESIKSGIGKVNAALCAQRLILQFGVTHIINTGIAGAMASGLGVLDVVVSKDAVYHDMDATGFGYKKTQIPQMKTSAFKADKKMIDAATIAFAELKEAAGHQLVVGRIASGDQFISDRSQKDEIRRSCKPACVEMEGTAIAHAAYLNKIPFAIIRCMSDMADDTGEKTYSFNETKAAALSAKLVCAMLPLF